MNLYLLKVKLKSFVTLSHPPGCIEQAWTEWIPACKGAGVGSLRQLVGWTNSRVVFSLKYHYHRCQDHLEVGRRLSHARFLDEIT